MKMIMIRKMNRKKWIIKKIKNQNIFNIMEKKYEKINNIYES